MGKVAEPVLRERFILGEGALWSERDKVLYWVDITGCKVFAYDPVTGKNMGWGTPSLVGTVVERKKGGLMVALKDGFAGLDTKTGKVTKVATVVEPGNRFNDGKCDPAGRLWAGTIGDNRSAALYRLDVDHSVHKVFGSVACSNGIVWTKDRKTMYYIDTPCRNIRAWDYDDATGDISNERVAVDVPAEMGHPDGMAMDVAGNLWVAMWGGEGVRCFDPRKGKAVDFVKCPGSPRTTSCAFGGKDRKTLFVTSASEGMKEEELKKAGCAGNLFAVEVGVEGEVMGGFGG